jgi:hypothetical protein
MEVQGNSGCGATSNNVVTDRRHSLFDNEVEAGDGSATMHGKSGMSDNFALAGFNRLRVVDEQQR